MLPSYILLTALAAQLVYILVNWYFFRRKEYQFYSLYIVVVSVYFLNKYMANNNGLVHIGKFEFLKFYPDKILAIISYIFYFKFGRHFVEAATRYPTMNRLMKYTEIFLLIYVLFDGALLFFTGNFKLENYIFLPVNILIFTVLIYVFRTMLKRNEILDRFILTGSMFYAVCACITMWLGQNKPPLEDDHILALQIGAVVEMILLNAGLVYKSRMLQTQTINSQKQLIERYEENQDLLLRLGNIRERISRDLHDDVGATLSTVKAYAEILKDNPDNPLIAELIRDNSAEMIEQLEVIAWATNPQHDNFKSLKNRMVKFAMPLCHLKKIQCNIESERLNEEMMMPGEVRQNIFLVFKEAINNMMKYSEATACNTLMFINHNRFVMQINDNGKGFDGTVKETNSGLKNMQKRTEELNGKIEIASSLDKGTDIIVRIPYPFRIPNSWDRNKH